MANTTSEPATVANSGRRAGGLGLLLAAFALVLLIQGVSDGSIVSLLPAFAGGAGIGLTFYLIATLVKRAWRDAADPNDALGPATVPDLHEQAKQAGGGAYLAHAIDGRWISAPAEVAALILAGPRAGKTSCVAIPALISHPAAAVCTSTKPEVFTATVHARRALGRVWFFDLTDAGAPAGAELLRWSPVQRASDWQGAQTVAEAMTGAAEIDHDSAHWKERASALIAACVHAAATAELQMQDVSSWILRHDPDSPLAELPPGSIAHDVLYGIKQTADREQSGIFSTAARVLRAYRSPAALNASVQPNFDPGQFISSRDTIYIAAAAHEQQLVAPLVVGLLTDIRHAVYDSTWNGGQPPWPPVLFLLDECANVAPIPDLPAMLSEAGGQGLQVICVFQDISQVRRRWPREADGFMSLFGARIILSGVADPRTLEQLSLLCGDWDRPIQTLSEQRPVGLFANPNQRTATESWTTRRERRVPPDRIAQLARGEALVMIGPTWELVPTLPYHQHPTFAPIATAAQLNAGATAAIADVRLLEAKR
jgi:type IV secretion system protein VirD4